MCHKHGHRPLKSRYLFVRSFYNCHTPTSVPSSVLLGKWLMRLVDHITFHDRKAQDGMHYLGRSVLRASFRKTNINLFVWVPVLPLLFHVVESAGGKLSSRLCINWKRIHPRNEKFSVTIVEGLFFGCLPSAPG